MITSAQNPKIKRIRSLLTERQYRQHEKMYVVEGVRLVEEALKSGAKPEIVLFSSGLSVRGRELLDRFTSLGCQVEEVDSRLLQSLSDTETTQGILAVLPQPSAFLPPDWDLILILDRIRDPGNLGTILRSGAASGVQAFVLTPASTDAYAPKVVRAAMGAHLNVPILTLDWPEITAACKRDRKQPADLLVADSTGGSPSWQIDFRHPLALVIGSEAEGPQPAALDAADGRVCIPMPGKAESLNAAVAASILLYEIIRQRNA